MDKRLINRLRKELRLDNPVISDNEILKITDGTITRAWAELGIAVEDFCIVINKYARVLRKQ